MKFSNVYNKLKNVGFSTFNNIKNGYNKAVKLAGNIDSGIKTIKNVYDDISPVVKKYIGKSAHNIIKDNLGENYNQIKNQIINKNNDLMGITNSINKYL